MNLAHQDWKPCIVRKKPNKSQDKSKKTKQPSNSLNDNKEEFKHKKISREKSQEIIKRRCELNMDRKQLSNKLNIKVDVLTKYETGNIVCNPTILNKIHKILKMT